MKLTILYEKNRHRVDRAAIRRLTQWLVSRGLRSRSPDTACGLITLILTDDDGMRQVNTRVFGRDRVTDVITCRYDPIPGVDAGVREAEIVINVDRAIDRARRGWPASRELALYIAHGCDHLAGADDETPAAAARMRRRELRWLREAGKLGLIGGLLP